MAHICQVLLHIKQYGSQYTTHATQPGILLLGNNRIIGMDNRLFQCILSQNFFWRVPQIIGDALTGKIGGDFTAFISADSIRNDSDDIPSLLFKEIRILIILSATPGVGQPIVR